MCRMLVLLILLLVCGGGASVEHCGRDCQLDCRLEFSPQSYTYIHFHTTHSNMEALKKELDEERRKSRATDELVKQLREDLVVANELESTRLTDAEEPQTVYVTKESRKIPTLKGKPQTASDVDVMEWIEDVESYLQARTMGEAQKIDYVMDHLGGSARWEIKLRPKEEKTSAAEILRIVGNVFGEPDSIVLLQGRFFQLMQRKDESILDYSVELMRLLEKVIKKDAQFAITREKTLKGKLTEGVREEALKRELRRLSMEAPLLKFWEFRDRAIAWMGDSDDKSKSTSVHYSSVQTTPTAAGATALDPAVAQALKQQQEQIDLLTKKLLQRQENYKPPGRRGFVDGKPVCFKCQSPDHRFKDCPHRQNVTTPQSGSLNGNPSPTGARR